jgi:predicted nuclease of predicted toxin-antitoxin system
MPWRRLEDPTETASELKKKTRFLIDESLEKDVATFLEQKGYNAKFVGEVGLTGHRDEDVFAFAWREKRLLLTHDRDFLDDARFSESRNPGLVFLPGGHGDNQAIGVGIAVTLSVFGAEPTVWEKTKSVVSSTGEMTIRKRDINSGKIVTDRFRLMGNAHAESLGG